MSELRRIDDGALVAELERGDITELVKAGWRAPEVFTAKGRDGQTDIWGVIIRPTNFDPAKKYPVIENIYAGPQGSFVPKSFSRVQRDAGPGRARDSSSCRSTAWGRRTARRRSTTSRGRTSATPGSRTAFSGTRRWRRRYPWYDISRVGIYGASAGGQNSLGGLLFHPEFYKRRGVGRRLPRQPDGQDLVERAVDGLADRPAVRRVVQCRQRVTGCRAKLLLVVGELDTNVDPVVDDAGRESADQARQGFRSARHSRRADTDRAAHTAEHKRFDFFVRQLLGATPPAWTKKDQKGFHRRSGASMNRFFLILLFAAALVARAAPAERIASVIPDVARPLPLSAVRLTGGPLKRAQELDAKYLLDLEPDRMLAFYRQRAGLVPKAQPYGGWDGDGRNLTGHIAGHYLSAVSLMWAATGDVRFKERADHIVTELKEVQDKHGDGYLERARRRTAGVRRTEQRDHPLGGIRPERPVVAVVHAAQDVRRVCATHIDTPGTGPRSTSR